MKKKKKLIYISTAIILVSVFTIMPFVILYGAFYNPQKNKAEFDVVFKQLCDTMVPALNTEWSEFIVEKKSWGSYKGIFILFESRIYFVDNTKKSFLSPRYDFKIIANKLKFEKDIIPVYYDNPFYGNEVRKQKYFSDTQYIDWDIIYNVPGKTEVFFNNQYGMSYSENSLGVHLNYAGPYAMVCKTQNSDKSSIIDINTINSLKTLKITNIFIKTSDNDDDIALSVPYFGNCSIENLEAYLKLSVNLLAQNQKIADIFLKSKLFGNININFAKRLEYLNTHDFEIIGIALKSKKTGFITDDELNTLADARVDLLSIKLISEPEYY